MMPEMTGIEVCEKVRKSDTPNRDVPIILLTAKVQEKDRLRAQEVQVSAYIVKPFRPIQFLESVESMLSDGKRGRIKHKACVLCIGCG